MTIRLTAIALAAMDAERGGPGSRLSRAEFAARAVAAILDDPAACARLRELAGVPEVLAPSPVDAVRARTGTRAVQAEPALTVPPRRPETAGQSTPGVNGYPAEPKPAAAALKPSRTSAAKSRPPEPVQPVCECGNPGELRPDGNYWCLASVARHPRQLTGLKR
jgi:hypothetical protein